jgi:hypothetical protein
MLLLQHKYIVGDRNEVDIVDYDSGFLERLAYRALLKRLAKLQIAARWRPRIRSVRAFSLEQEHVLVVRNNDGDANLWSIHWPLLLAAGDAAGARRTTTH